MTLNCIFKGGEWKTQAGVNFLTQSVKKLYQYKKYRGPK